MDYRAFRKEVFETTLELAKKDLIRLSSGNISMRLPDGNFAITPSGILYTEMHPESIVIMDARGNPLKGELKPSSEKALHLALYQARDDISAVVHTHSVYSIALSTVEIELPVICLELIVLGGPIPVAPYCCPGTPQVGEVAATYFKARRQLNGLLLKNHGAVVVGENLKAAFQNACNLETGAQIFHLAIQTGRISQPIPHEEIVKMWDVYYKIKAS